MSEINGIAKEIVKTIREDKNKGTKPYDTQATVMRVEDGTAWVRIPGGVDETPAQLTMDAKEGDNVQVRVSGGRAWLAGNGTSPPTDDTKAVEANENAKSASIAARAAFNAAENAQTDAERAHYAAEQAETDAAEAKTSATNASEYASRALGNLSTVQSVTETLNWITAHGTMTLTSDTALDPSHVYFVRNNDGDYVVGGNHYSVVTEPNVDNISTYYELTIDESLNNYVGTHLSVTSEGLWLLPDAGGNKVLIATGQGQTYTSAGTYIVGKVNGVDTVLASFTSNGAQIGKTSSAHMRIGSYSQKLLDEYGNSWEDVITQVQDSEDTDTLTTRGDGTRTKFVMTSVVLFTRFVTVNGVTAQEGVDFTRDGNVYEFNTAPAQGAEIVISSAIADGDIHYTFGTRNEEVSKGFCSFAEGILTEASGYASHAEGTNTRAQARESHTEGSSTRTTGDGFSHAEGMNSTASGYASHAEGTRTGASGNSSHAEGLETVASGPYSHAQNYGTLASSNYQTALGKCNEEDANDKYALIIGNGTSNNNRSNALTVDWNGVPVGHNSNGTEIDYEISDATIALYDALAGGTSWRE